jgi:putative phosphoesterase
MRIAIISDIHGNEIALNVILSDIQKFAVDQIICLGDIATLGPSPSRVIQTVRDLKCPCILGNHDAFLTNPEALHTYTEAQIIVEAVEWCRSQLSTKDLNFLATFQPSIELIFESNYKILFFHGSPRSNTEDILSTTSPLDLDQILQHQKADILAGGHTHIQMLREHRGILIINPGSVGFPFKAYVAGKMPTLLGNAAYAFIDIDDGLIEVSLRRIAYKKDLLIKSLRDSTNPLRNWLIQQYA